MEMKPLSEIAINLINHIHDTIPEADTKEGTFIRDIFVDPIAAEIAALYREAKLVEIAQSILTASGAELDKLAKNYFVDRRGATRSTGRLRFYLGTSEPIYDIYIARGTIASTVGKNSEGTKYYVTDSDISIIAGNRDSYLKDLYNNKWYVEVGAVAQQLGSFHNTGIGTITEIGSSLDSTVSEVTNPFAFTGGTDQEDDASLMLKLSLAISGSNIGTKDGYRSFILSQASVSDTIIVGAKDPLMKRDNGEGGMVDIYVRSESSNVDTFNFLVDYDYTLNNVSRPAYADILFNKQPVLSVTELVGNYPAAATPDSAVKKYYINGSNFKIEKGTFKYYQDIPWDTDFKNVPITGLTGTNLQKAEATNTLNTKLKNFLAIKDIRNNVYYDRKLVDISYNTDFSLIDPTLDSVLPLDMDFYRGYYTNGALQLILSKTDSINPFVGGRYFLQKDGKLFERVYHQPDFIVVKDIGINSNSVMAKDAIHWIPNSSRSNLPKVGETLSITYSYNRIISELQEKIELKRVLTADVLIKSARKIPIEIKLEVVPSVGVDREEIRKTIINKLTNYINDRLKMGEAVDRSDIAFISRGTEGIDAVKLDSIFISIEDLAPVPRVSLDQNEYMQLSNVYVKVLSPGTVV